MRFTLEEIARIAGGTVLGDGAVEVSGAGIDSRRLEPGCLFVPVVGRRDGHDFIDSAMAAGAAAHLTNRGGSEHPAVAVDDTVTALQGIGRAARGRIRGPVVAITGSVGKTTTKDLLGAVLATTYRAHVSELSFNNELGVPLTLASAPEDTGVAVLEMGARGIGHIALLCNLASPDVGVVTRVGKAHTELFGSLEAVAAAKGELVEALPRQGIAVLNADDVRVIAMAGRTSADVLTFGVEAGDVRAGGIALDDDLRASFRLDSPWGSVRVRLPFAGSHSVVNACAAAAAGLAVGVGVEAVAEGLAGASVSPWRMELFRAPSGAAVLNDAYNANPVSMSAALDSLMALRASNRIAVLGVMAELGDDAEAEHGSIGRKAAEAGLSVISVGVGAYGGLVVASAAEAVSALEHMLEEKGPLGPEVAVLVKGSRVAGLEAVADWLAAHG